MKRRLLIGIVVGLLVLGTVFTVAVSAAGPAAGRDEAAPAFVDEDGDGVCDLCGDEGGMGFRGRWADGSSMTGPGRGRGMGSYWNANGLTVFVANELGLTVDELATELEDLGTLRQVIASHGLDAEAIAAGFIAERESTLDELVAEGRLTVEQKDLMLEHMATEINEHLDSADLDCAPQGGGRGRGGMRNGTHGAPRTWGSQTARGYGRAI